jgi:hypothetical protein
MSTGFRRKSRFPWGTILAGGVVIIVVAAPVVYFIVYGFPSLEKPGGKEPSRATPVHESKEFNYRFTFPDSAWKLDNPTRMNVKANLLAMRRSNPTAWFALAGHAYKTSTPEKTQLVDEVVKRLEGYFQELEWDPAPDGFLAQRPAWVIVFQGKADNTLVKGECYILSHKNIVYWFTTWCAMKDAPTMASEWSKLRDGFSLLEIREN